MSGFTKNEGGFVGYEYKEVTVKKSMEAVYVDGYTNFGWLMEGESASHKGFDFVNINMKRDRKIPSKMELTRLQRQFEAGVLEIQALEFSKVMTAAVVAFGLGIVGTAFMAGSVFSYVGGILPLCIVLAVPGFLGWILPYFCYSKISKDKTDQITPLIEKKYDEIYGVCEKANILLNK